LGHITIVRIWLCQLFCHSVSYGANHLVTAIYLFPLGKMLLLMAQKDPQEELSSDSKLREFLFYFIDPVQTIFSFASMIFLSWEMSLKFCHSLFCGAAGWGCTIGQNFEIYQWQCKQNDQWQSSHAPRTVNWKLQAWRDWGNNSSNGLCRIFTRSIIEAEPYIIIQFQDNFMITLLHRLPSFNLNMQFVMAEGEIIDKQVPDQD